MYAPKEIADYLEPILSIYLSDFRHKERTAFILCDNLIELCCKTRIKQRDPNDNQNKDRNFTRSLKDAKLPKEFIRILETRHKIRNDIQHEKIGLGIETQDCACDILNVIKVIKKLWGKYALDFASDWIICAIRIIELYSTSSNQAKKNLFEKKLLNEINWIAEANIGTDKVRALPLPNEITIEIGAKKYWALLIREETELVSQCLDEVF